MSFQSRRWCLTWNNYPEDVGQDKPQFVEAQLRLFCTAGTWGWEQAPETGTLHVQGYLFVNKKVTLSGLKKLLTVLHEEADKIHLEPAKGNTWQNRQYCKKSGTFLEFGDFPKDGEPEGASEAKKPKLDYAAAYALAQQGEFEAIPAELKIKHYKTLKEIGVDASTKPADLPECAGLWITGRAGYGKSYAARHTHADGAFYTKDFTKWWGGYNGEPTVILDDFAPKHAKAISDELKIWGDVYPFNAEIKGGHTGWIRPRRFIVTSQYTIGECFTDARTFDAINRRFKQIKLEYKWDDPRAASGPSVILPTVRHDTPAGPSSSSAGDDAVLQPAQPSPSALSTLDIDPFEGYWQTKDGHYVQHYPDE